MNKDKHQTVALQYDGKSAPKVTAKGDGFIAQQIIATAKEHGIPIQQNEELTALLSNVQINHEIPRDLYTAVAQIIAFLYYMDSKVSGKGEEEEEEE